jgi:alpha-L-fucosidase
MKPFLRIVVLILSFALSAHSATPEAMKQFATLKNGFFVHYVWAGGGGLTLKRDGSAPQSIDELADGFDAEGFARDMESWGVEYVIFTAWHANLNPLFPSKTMERWGMPTHRCRRDLLGDMIRACKAKNIPVVLYTHPRDGHDLRGEDRVKTGWGANPGANPSDPNWGEFDYQKWNDFTNELYAELVDRYGKDIIGLFLDEGSSAGDSQRVVDYPRLRQTIKSRAPHLVLQQNYYGTNYSCDVGVKEYHHWQEFENRDGGAWRATDIPAASVFATTWWAAKPDQQNTVVYSAEDMFRFTVLQAGVNTVGGGMQWAAGPYPGGGWEPGVRETMEKFASYLKPVASSLKGTLASTAFPTQKGAALKSIGWGVRAIEWGVATDSADRQRTYLHVLNPPSGPSLFVGMPANGKRFHNATLLPSGQKVGLELTRSGYRLTLPAGSAWNPVHTVIQLDP